MIVNFGKEGRCRAGLVEGNESLMRMIVSVVEFYEALAKKQKPIKGKNVERPTPETAPWHWMEEWLLGYDEDHGGEQGREIMDWIWTADCGC